MSKTLDQLAERIRALKSEGKKVFPRDLRAEVGKEAQALIDDGHSPNSVARDLGIAGQTLSKWLDAAQAAPRQAAKQPSVAPDAEWQCKTPDGVSLSCTDPELLVSAIRRLAAA